MEGARRGNYLFFLATNAGTISGHSLGAQKYNFPAGELEYRKGGETYKDAGERIVPDILIEDDCETIGGEKEMISPHLKPEVKNKVKSIVVKEFGGIDHLSDDAAELFR